MQPMMRSEILPAPSVPFPGIPGLQDGSGAIVWVETLASQGACAYPITPSTPMGVGFEAEAAAGKRNAWGEPLAFFEPESEHSSASACEGFALGGGRITNFTSGQGLVLMKEVLHVIAGKRLPCVFHVAARALSWHALNIHAGHDDIFAVIDAGWGVLFARNAQEAADLALIARAAAERSQTPFFVVQDGFITSHTLETLSLPEPELVRELLGPPDGLNALMDPSQPLQSGTVQNQDAYMRGRIAQRVYARSAAPAVTDAMERYAALTGRCYRPVDAYRADDADLLLVCLGSMARTAEVACDHARERGLRAGVVHLTALRPFFGAEVARRLWRAKAVAVIERLDAPLHQSNPLCTEVKAALCDGAGLREGYPGIGRLPAVYEGVAGLGGREVTVGMLEAAFLHLAQHPVEPRSFVLGVHAGGALTSRPEPPPEGYVLRGHSVGGFGSVATNKLLADLLWRLLGVRIRAWPHYGSEKKGMPTTYFLQLSDRPPRAQCEPSAVDFVAVHTPRAFEAGDPLRGLRDGGCLYVQAAAATEDELRAALPPHVLARAKRLCIVGLDALRIARDLAPRPDLVQRFQGVALVGAFLRASPLAAPLRSRETELWDTVSRAVFDQFGRHGKEVAAANLEAVRRGFDEAVLLGEVRR